MAIYLVSYRPLCYNSKGRKVGEQFDNIPKFVDHSTRREPNLELPYPSISAICRGPNFAPRLKVGDIIVYITTKFKIPEKHWRLVAVLKAVHICKDHQEAKEWYSSCDLPIPNNCMVDETNPIESRYTAKSCADENEYKQLAKDYPQYVICEKFQHLDTKTPPSITEGNMNKIFNNKIPSTETPPEITQEQLEYLLRYTKL